MAKISSESVVEIPRRIISMDEIKRLEKVARLLDPDATQRTNLLSHVVGHAENYLKKIAGARTYSVHPDNDHSLYDSPITEEGISIDQVLEILDENVDSTGVNLISGRYLGYIPGGGLFILHLAIIWLQSQTDLLVYILLVQVQCRWKIC